MNKFKRKLVFNELLEEPTKNFEVSYLSYGTNVIDIFLIIDQLITCLEDLSNEIFYEMFEWL
jgi:hypothetical protein